MKQKLLDLRKSLTGPLLFWIASMLANIFNWLYNLQAGRTLSKEEFGILTVFISFQYLLSVPANSLATTVTRFTAFYTAKGEREKHFYFFRQYWWLSWCLGLIFLGLLILFSSAINNFFGVSSPHLLSIFAITLIPLFLVSFEKGTLSGQMAFAWIGILYITESITKLGFLYFSKSLPFSQLELAVFSLPFSVMMAWFISLLIARSFHPLPVKVEGSQTKEITDTYKFLGNSIFASIGAILIYNMDVLLVKHFFSSSEAGVYSTLSLLGKMLYFGAGSLIGLLVPLTARAQAQNSSGSKPFFILLSIVSFVGISIWLSYLLFPHFIVQTLLTGKGLVALPYLTRYSLGMLFLALSSCFVAYNLAKKNYLPARLVLFAALLQGILISLFHNSLGQVVNVVTATLLGLFLTILVSEALKLNLTSLSTNFKSLISLFFFEKFSFVQSEKKNKHILIFNWRDTKHVYGGGAEVYIDEIAKRLVKKDFEVTLFTSNDGHNTLLEKVNGVSIIRRGGFMTVYIWAFLYYIFKFKGKFDLIIDCENGVPFFSPIYTKKPVILLVHHVHQDIFFSSLLPPFSWIANFMETYLMPRVYKNSQVVAVSPSTADELEKEIGIKTTAIISNGIDTKVYLPQTKSLKPLICYVGRLKKYKSIEILLQAFKRIVVEIPNAKLVIAGEGDYRRNLEIKTEELGITRKVEFLGKISEEKKIAILAKSWVMVQPSFQEGWGITCIEANACKTPVIASNVPGLRDAVVDGQSGYLFEYGNVTELAGRLKQLLLSQTERDLLSEKSWILSQKFSWDTQAKKYSQLIDQILESQKETAHRFNPSLLRWNIGEKDR